jgi:membrane protein YqaA with SNARE-associated domain
MSPTAEPETLAAAPRRRAGPLKRLYRWVLSWADSRYGSPALFLIAFAESSFFPIPPDVLQIALSVGRPRRSFWYAAVACAGSVSGAILGWWIGHALWESMATFFFEYVPGFTEHNFDLVRARYDEHAFLAIFGAAFTPIPFKVFTIASGVFEVALGTLLIASTLGRGARFFLVGSSIFFFGPKVKGLLERYFELITLALLVLLVAGFAAIKFLL